MVTHPSVMESQANATVIECRDLSKQFTLGDQPLQLFTDINFTIKAQQSVAIVGPSGAGKSTLLSLLAGMDLPSAGEVQILGRATHTLTDQQRAELRRDQISFIFQSFHLLPELTALENVLLPLEIRGLDADEAEQQAKITLTQVGLAHRLDHRPAHLSGGEQQRVAIARAFATRPNILFADEPTGNLDERTSDDIVKLLFELNSQHRTTLVLITHDTTLAQRCERCFHLKDGQIHEAPQLNASQHTEVAL